MTQVVSQTGYIGDYVGKGKNAYRIEAGFSMSQSGNDMTVTCNDHIRSFHVPNSVEMGKLQSDITSGIITLHLLPLVHVPEALFKSPSTSDYFYIDHFKYGVDRPTEDNLIWEPMVRRISHGKMNYMTNVGEEERFYISFHYIDAMGSFFTTLKTATWTPNGGTAEDLINFEKPNFFESLFGRSPQNWNHVLDQRGVDPLLLKEIGIPDSEFVTPESLHTLCDP